MPIIFVTGATSGFGRAIAVKFAEQGWNIIANGRRVERLLSLKKELEERYKVNVLCLPFDVSDAAAVKQQMDTLPSDWNKIDILVNNAGLALGRDSFDVADMTDWNIMIDTNIKGILHVTKAVLPFMKSHQAGHIINIGSIAGKETYPAGNVYCATKFAVDALSKSMRIDLLPFGIKVTCIHPGAAETEFSMVRYKGDQTKADKIYEGYTPLFAEDIANITYYCSQLPAHVCINELVVTPTAQANSYLIHKNL